MGWDHGQQITNLDIHLFLDVFSFCRIYRYTGRYGWMVATEKMFDLFHFFVKQK